MERNLITCPGCGKGFTDADLRFSVTNAYHGLTNWVVKVCSWRCLATVAIRNDAQLHACDEERVDQVLAEAERGPLTQLWHAFRREFF